MAAKDDAAREISNVVGQESSRPERAAAQLCQLKLRFEYSPQPSPQSMPSANSKRRLEASTSPLSSGPCSPSVEALLAATVSRVESAVANEIDATSATTKLSEKKAVATQVVTTPVSSKFRSRDVSSTTTPRKQSQESNAKAVPAVSVDSSNGQAVATGSSNGTAGKTTPASSTPSATSTTVICKLTSDPNPASPKTPAKQAKAVSLNSQTQTPTTASTASSQNGIRIVHGVPLKMPIVYIDDYMNCSVVVERNSESSKSCSSPGLRSRSGSGDQADTDTALNGELETTPNITRSLKRLSEEDMMESTPKKQSALMIRKKELDCPVLSPVMRDSIDSPGSPMTRSMSRRIEESTSATGDSSVSKTVIAVNLPCGNASSSENEESTLSLPPKSFLQKKVQFNKVSLYLFEREQGFTSVPSEGGSTLGECSSRVVIICGPLTACRIHSNEHRWSGVLIQLLLFRHGCATSRASGVHHRRIRPDQTLADDARYGQPRPARPRR